jgi:hypothetical protein
MSWTWKQLKQKEFQGTQIDHDKNKPNIKVQIQTWKLKTRTQNVQYVNSSWFYYDEVYENMKRTILRCKILSINVMSFNPRKTS